MNPYRPAFVGSGKDEQSNSMQSGNHAPGVPAKTFGMLLIAAAALIFAGWLGGTKYGARR